jgi:hypothetical protein
MNEPSAAYSLAFYYPGSSRVGEDGTLEVRASWWDNGGHSSGVLLVTPADPYYAMWFWLMKNPERFPQVREDDLAAVYAAFEEANACRGD